MISTLDVTGYRLLSEFRADFGQLTVVIGANATGKSTALDCLQFICQCTELPLQTVVDWHGGMDSILSASGDDRQFSLALTFERPAENPYWSKMPLEDKRQYVYHTVLARDIYGQASAQYEVLRNAEPLPDYEQPLKYLEATPNRSWIFSPKQHRLVQFDAAVGELRDGRNIGELEVKKPGVANNAITTAATPPSQVAEQERSLLLAKMRFLNEYPVPSWTRMLLGSFAFYPGFDVGRYSNLRTKPAEIRPQTILAPYGENLGTVLHELFTRADYQQAAEDLREFLRAAYPYVEDIFAETTYGAPAKVLVRVREKGMARSMDLWEVSDGMVRFLCLGAALLNPLPPPLIALDEPEAGLHPRLLPIVGDMLKMAAERAQVLVTTHSPDLLSCFELPDVAVMVREGPQILWQRPANRETLRMMLRNVVGETLGDLHRSGELEAI